jgi:uncharacterized membrane protein
MLALAVFVGGQLVLVASVVPVLRAEPDEVMLRVARRFGVVTAVAIAVLLATGIAMASHFSLWQNDTLQAKLVLLAFVAVLVGLHIASPRSRGLSLALVASSVLVVWLGVELTH